MTVEEIKGLNGDYDNFPVGMRVLAVDDDPICLKVLETTLRKCQYQVTTTSQARVALRMLRENRDRFDLIISDVQMPDMDGFKLLELVGLEMDLPVIMLSAYSDPKLVMKGVTHGACDYLVKPVRIEELRNIWQHVIRKKKIEPKHQNQNQNGSSDQETYRQGNTEGGPGGSFTNSGGGGDQNGKPNKKRKDENNENEDNDNENEDPSTQKKPRVVWSPELHRKFVSAVEHLGIEKAVPKRILDMMNVEGISRENVASHLQKYRLYLKRISSQQGNRISSLDGFGDFRGYSVPGRLTNTILSPYSQTGILPRLNSPNGLNLHSFNSPSLIPQNHGQSFSNPINTFGKFNPLIIPGNQKENLAQGSFNVELDQFHHNNNSRMFTTGGPLSNSLTNCVPNGGGFVNQGSFNNGSFNPQLANFPALTESLGNVRENHSSTMANLINPLEYSATNSVSGVSDVSLRRGLNGQEGFIQNVNQRQGVVEQNYVNNSDNMFGNLNTRLLGNNGGQNLDQMNMRCFNGDGLQAIELEKITTEIGTNQESLLEYTKPGQDYDLDDLIKREHDGAMLDGQFVFDSAFPFGQCLGDS